MEEIPTLIVMVSVDLGDTNLKQWWFQLMEEILTLIVMIPVDGGDTNLNCDGSSWFRRYQHKMWWFQLMEEILILTVMVSVDRGDTNLNCDGSCAKYTSEVFYRSAAVLLTYVKYPQYLKSLDKSGAIMPIFFFSKTWFVCRNKKMRYDCQMRHLSNKDII